MTNEHQTFHPTLESLPYWSPIIDGSQSVKNLFELFDKNIQIPGILVLDGQQFVGLIPREKLYEKLGRPFGVELFLKNSVKQFYEGLQINPFMVASDISIADAVQAALNRENSCLYDPIVISHPNGYRLVTMYNLLMAQQQTLQQLYSEVHTLSIVDSLTHVHNRRGFFELANQKMINVRRNDLEYAIFTVDIDHFKSVNDRYGHQVGDEVLCSAAQQIANNLSPEDILGRFGGEEFVIFAADVNEEAAWQLAEKLRQGIASSFHKVNGFQIRVTVCIGTSQARGASKLLDVMLSESDKAMYAAKNMGRNRVVRWNESLEKNMLPFGRKSFRDIENNSAPLINQFSEQILQVLLHMLYLRDCETETHTIRVAQLAIEMAQKIGLPEKYFEGVYIGALLHDIGKIILPDTILFKREALTDSDWAVLQKHPQYAYDLISPVAVFQDALDIPYCHHEHWDGSGYPRGLRGTAIPITARMFTIVDAYDALTSDRPYRAAWPCEKAIEYIIDQKGKMFDPDLVPVFLDILVSREKSRSD